jgi:hypothetical protein
VHRAVTGYVAFLTLVIYLVALAMLPHALLRREPPGALEARGTTPPRGTSPEALTRHEHRGTRHDR